MDLKTDRLNVQMSDITGSTFSKLRAENMAFHDVNLAGTSIHNANMSGMAYNDINMQRSMITNVNLSNTRIQHASLSNAQVDHVHLFGTTFTNVVLPQKGDGNYREDGGYAPITFDHCQLSNTRITNCDLSGVEIADCDITGLKINGIPVEQLLKHYSSHS
ncbi:pentapeptide repeat-containing protein [Paenibacillus sp. GCM10023248]|uniref:pentapeptide repeat-containing protein n=1 Tax=unclassified Paenibacillus TaxID=185978 RepID=UPI002379E613|nr:pentapeptide repeat-containing protein [Paenibacillus sp. MAHUQ-63]MDD9268812.1 pentapeptide repeat-containing protein [Paenibacillus sp. MAHUQ-63]